MSARLFLCLATALWLACISSPLRFAAQAVELEDLPEGCFTIEAEHFDYDGGKAVEAVNTMPYKGDEYNGLSAVHQVDYLENEARTEGDLYRPHEDPNVPMIESLGGQPGSERPGFAVEMNYRIGWVGEGEWYNYTRLIPAGYYKAYAALSIDRLDPGLLRGRLGLVTDGAGTDQQNVADLGEFNGAGSGAWGRNNLVVLTNAAGYDAVFQLAGGPTTLRFIPTGGEFDWFTLVPALPTVTSAKPFPGSTVPRHAELDFVITDYQTAVVTNSIILLLDDQDVTATAQITHAPEGTRVHYQPPALLGALTQHSYALSFQDNAATPRDVAYTGAFSVNVFAPGSFIVEAEDFNFDGGKTKAEASAMPYLGGAYDGLGAVHNVDYHNDDAGGGDIYRKGESPNVSLGTSTDLNRGDWDVRANYMIGRVDPGDWQNYTRNFASAIYEVYASLAHESTAAHSLAGSLQQVISGADGTQQSLVGLGRFDAPGTGAWGRYAFVPLAAADASQVKVALSGTQTLRWNGQSGDMDYLVLVPTGPATETADLLIRAGAEAFAGQKVYQTMPSGVQVATQAVGANRPAVFDVQVVNDGTAAHSLEVHAEESSDLGWTVTCRVGATDVSAQVRSVKGYATAILPSGGNEIIRVEMTPGAALFTNARKETTFQVFPEISVTPHTDSVKAVAVTVPTIQPDILVRRETDAVYLGDGIYNNTGASQTGWLEVEPDKPARFRLQLQNDGNRIDQYVLRSSNGGGGWTVKYYTGTHGLVFDGVSDYVDCRGGWSAGTRWTVEAWVKPQAQAALAGRRSIAGGSGGCLDWGIALQDGQFGVVARPPGDCSVTVASEITPELNRWYHVAGSCDATNAKVYVNGQLLAADKVLDNYSGTQGGFRIGGDISSPGNNFPGVIREVRVWDRARTAEEIRAGMNQRLKGDEPGLVGYWPLAEGLGRLAFDQSGHQHDGTLQNSPAWGTLSESPDLVEITAFVTSTGWTNLALYPAIADDLVVEVTPDRTVAGGSVKELLVTAASTSESSKADTVKLVTVAAATSATPEGGTYTTSADFEKGRRVGVEYDTIPDQIQLTRESVTLPYLWVPNSNEGTVSKLDTYTGRELARYRTCPWTDASPSRTTVDLYGNCWLGNRQRGTVVKIGLLENGQYLDRNGNGKVDTSYDRNDDGNITPDEMLPWGEDECVLYEILLVPGQEQTYTPGDETVRYANDYWNPGPRGLAVDARGNVWAGTYGGERFYYISETTGQILQTNNFHHTSYGAVISRDGVLWSAGYNYSFTEQSYVLRFDPRSGDVKTVSLGHATYGLGLDHLGHLFVSGWQDAKLSRIDVASGTVDWTHEGLNESRGVAVTDDNDVWVANSAPGTVARWSNDGQLKTQIPVGTTPTGVSVDAAGKVWVVNNGDEFVKRINPATDSIDLAKRIVGGLHYGYSDMTGILARQTTTRLGSWSIIHNAQMPNTPWDNGSIAWHSDEPPGTTIRVRTRTSNDQANWSLWRDVPNGTTDAKLTGLIPGRFIEVEAVLQSDSAEVSPILKDLTITPGNMFVFGNLAYFDDFEAPPGPEWSDARTDVTPIGQRKFLGQFGNQSVTLSLSNLPPHTAVTASFDLFVLGRWDGNDTTAGWGPDVVEVRLAGGLVLAHTTFNNAHPETVAAGQACPDGYPGGNHLAHTGAKEFNTLGFSVPGIDIMDAVYHLQYTFAHTANFLKFVVEGMLDGTGGIGPQAMVGDGGATWGLDNFQVNVTSPPVGPPPELTALGVSAEGLFQMRLVGTPQINYAIDCSTDLKSWTAIVTNRLQSDRFDYSDPQSLGETLRFYRARSVE